MPLAARRAGRGDEDARLVDLAGGGEGGGEGAAALEEEAGDAAAAEVGERGGDAVGDEDLGAGVAQRRPRPPRARRRRAPATGRGCASSCESSGRRARRSKTTRSGWRAPATSRAVSRGSSARTVPMPTAIASDSARQRWTSSRLCSPEIQGESPGAVAVRPSSDIASFRVTSGRPVRACLRKGWLSSRAAVASSPAANSTSTPPSRRIPGPAPGGLLARIVGGDHDPRDPRLEDRLGAGRLAALVRAGLQRHVHRRPGRVVAARAAVGERRPLGVQTAELGVEPLADRPRRRARPPLRPEDWG